MGNTKSDGVLWPIDDELGESPVGEFDKEQIVRIRADAWKKIELFSVEFVLGATSVEHIFKPFTFLDCLSPLGGMLSLLTLVLGILVAPKSF